ncbi:MAG: DUF4058 family protein [Chloroflexi bacterium AL-W]|nr:DUF4058 family protein [Chloroflexi bacterium AL-N1]NOK70075.1 DUF4058 family protein [Chloroflexi bacterium AL-N10]NOK77913.1 DUF4058 family protein [Chloroflexi bacterium AL-N5]NOK84922.1 DUF4058 family protein [Chloroflexi bacterium AL-W]NOK91901.1 DUF4058 family protein [Chloroflexi bacterium AL-N15]
MPSPFPGMDPYLEGYLWPDVHNALAGKVRQLLMPLLRPRYVARLEIYVVEDSAPEGDIGIMYPDIEVILAQPTNITPTSLYPLGSSEEPHMATPATVAIPMILPIEVQVVNVEIRDAADHQLVTALEILSPVNKREPELTPYRQKRQRLYQDGVHLVEIDLLRRGTRPVIHPRIPESSYIVSVTRAQTGKTDMWSIGLRDPLPRIPIPLRPPDTDVILDLEMALSAIYDEAGYDLSINYTDTPPPPTLSDDDTQWMKKLLTSPASGSS